MICVEGARPSDWEIPCDLRDMRDWMSEAFHRVGWFGDGARDVIMCRLHL